MRGLSTAAVWCVSLLAVGVGALLAGQFVFMATSLDPAATIADGGDAWWDAGIAVAAFVGLALVCVLGLALWHTRRFKLVAPGVVVLEIVAVAWACARVYAEYF